LLIGIGAGALAALVLAPKTGKQFRRDLKPRYEDAKETVQDWTEEAKDRVRDVKESCTRCGRNAAQASLMTCAKKRKPLRRAINRSNCLTVPLRYTECPVPY